MMYPTFEDLFTTYLDNFLSNYKVSRKEIKWIGSKDGTYVCDWSKFSKFIEQLDPDDIEYSSLHEYKTLANYLSNTNSNSNLVLVADNWWVNLNDSSRDNQFYWEFHQHPKIAANAQEFTFIPGEIEIKEMIDGVFVEEGFCIKVENYTSSPLLEKVIKFAKEN